MYDYMTTCPACGMTLKASPSKVRGEWHDMAYCPTCKKTWDVCCAEAFRLVTPPTPVQLTVNVALAHKAVRA